MLGKLIYGCSIILAVVAMCSYTVDIKAGSRTSNGGDLVLVQNGTEYFHAFSLDLVEYSLQNAFYRYAPGENDQPLEGYKLFQKPCESDGIYHGGGRYNIDRNCKVVFMDTTDMSIAKKLLEKRLISNLLFEDPRPNGSYSGWLERALYEAGLINLLYEIRKVSPEYANAIIEKMESLNWLVVDSRLEPVADEDSPISAELMYQIARNDDNEVRISTSGWSKLIQPVIANWGSRNNFAQELDHTNKMAVIFHEVISAIAKSQGDTTTKRARKANAHLFMRSPEKIKKSYEILFPK